MTLFRDLLTDYKVARRFEYSPLRRAGGRGYYPTMVKFNDALISSQSLDMPKPTPVKFEVLNETLPVYHVISARRGRFS